MLDLIHAANSSSVPLMLLSLDAESIRQGEFSLHGGNSVCNGLGGQDDGLDQGALFPPDSAG